MVKYLKRRVLAVNFHLHNSYMHSDKAGFVVMGSSVAGGFAVSYAPGADPRWVAGGLLTYVISWVCALSCLGRHIDGKL